jgi:hypothetical protein
MASSTVSSLNGHHPHSARERLGSAFALAGRARHRFRQVAPSTDESFIERLALRRLRTQSASDHFFGALERAEPEPKRRFGYRPKKLEINPAEALRLTEDLRSLINYEFDSERKVLSVTQLRGCVHWELRESYSSLAAFANAPSPLRNGHDAGPDSVRLLESILASEGGLLEPRVLHHTWDDTYWWYDRIPVEAVGRLLRLCLHRNIELLFAASLVTASFNEAVAKRLLEHWYMLLCSAEIRIALEHVRHLCELPCLSFEVPCGPTTPLVGFDAELPKVHEQNAAICDHLVCFPRLHPDAAGLAIEMTTREDVVDILAQRNTLVAPVIVE